jgi:hypothetical protein
MIFHKYVKTFIQKFPMSMLLFHKKIHRFVLFLVENSYTKNKNSSITIII